MLGRRGRKEEEEEEKKKRKKKKSKLISKLVFYAQSTSAVISGR